ncbi:hypothetical protein COO60DRAFT_490707 [Scenedesmus sp. NREL 46B-D3]|nr:hypothetical protein COO60DRAFT_490707 [Scenedesmus sp. NREL 46B-D3]
MTACTSAVQHCRAITTLPHTLLQVSHTVKSAMAATKPMLSADEAASMTAILGITTQQQEQVLLDTLVGLLLEGRYFPLSSEEWAVAQCNEFTFDIPVQIDWRVLDDQLLAHFWRRHESAAATPKTNSKGSSSGSAAKPSSELGGSSKVAGRGRSSSSTSGVPLDRSQLPDFFDRMLVFHRGMGVATAEGLYLDKKLDLLVAYLVVAPVSSALSQLRAAPAAWLARGKHAAAGGAAASSSTSPILSAVAAAAKAVADKFTVVQQHQQPPAAKPPSKLSTANWRNMSPMDETGAADDDVGDDDDGDEAEQQLQPSPSADLAHQYARLVLRRSLRSEMPGPRQVLEKLFTKLTLLEPTFRDVVVLYRANTQEAAAEAAASGAQAESVMAAAAYADSGSAPMAADSLVEAARAAAEARTSTSSSSSMDDTTRPQQQQHQLLQRCSRPATCSGRCLWCCQLLLWWRAGPCAPSPQ